MPAFQKSITSPTLYQKLYRTIYKDIHKSEVLTKVKSSIIIRP